MVQVVEMKKELAFIHTHTHTHPERKITNDKQSNQSRRRESRQIEYIPWARSLRCSLLEWFPHDFFPSRMTSWNPCPPPPLIDLNSTD
jgi:hypothetical protein